MGTGYAGIWVDHRQAYIVWLRDDGKATVEHEFPGFPENRSSAGLPVSGRPGVRGSLAPHGALSRKQRQHCRRFYDNVLHTVRDVPHVYIIGPGQAKKELAKRLREHKDFHGRLDAVEAAQKMRPAAIVAIVCRFFGLASRSWRGR